MTRIIRSLDEIAPGYRVLYCDLWGCLHDGTRALPDAVDGGDCRARPPVQGVGNANQCGELAGKSMKSLNCPTNVGE